ncbi:unnamed protein product [Parnassius apollo]|uniref:(apollo) hypothetical protein n=1 Tax=Parnassius apollo TaxID=110799 RepID=A0A8S3WZ31_PARAO|nr:unnamed protein product [Parnassius apollo]
MELKFTVFFVKPSEDGITGDLYVAATEDNGITSEWLTDQPINFLSKPSASQSQAASMPVTYTSSLTTSSSPHEETVTTKKRAVFTSPAVKYAYALPVPGPTDGNSFNPYPYAYYAPSFSKPGEESQCRLENVASPATGVHPYPYPYYYPHMMTALSAAMNALKEGDEDSSANVSQPAQHGWPTAYTYPYQYIMVDPATWALSQTATSGKVDTGATDDE